MKGTAPSARRQAYLERFAKEPPAIRLRRSRRTRKVRRSPLPGAHTFLHALRLLA